MIRDRVQRVSHFMDNSLTREVSVLGYRDASLRTILHTRTVHVHFP
jgi:hypothetical protein